jgi:phosphoglycolate phosphatase
MAAVAAIFFDVDGVLIDSLEAHLQICRDKSREFGLNVAIPEAPEFRELVRSGVSVSPMKQFFVAVGFPEPWAERANEDYKREFVQRYALAPFSGVREMLIELAGTGVALGVVTSNTRANVKSALRESASLFRPDLLFTVDDPRRLGKAEALRAGAAGVEIATRLAIYVGDQPKDFEAARDAGTQFLGVTFGWGISPRDTQFDTVDSVEELTRELGKRVRGVRFSPNARGPKGRRERLG